MPKHYSSFLVRCWRLPDDEVRLEVRHIQSDSRVRLASVAAAVEWIVAHAAEAVVEPRGAFDQPSPPRRVGEEYP